MPVQPTILMLTLVLTVPGQITPRAGLWQVSSRLTGSGKVFGGDVPPITGKDQQCITSELWAGTLSKPTMPPPCTILSRKGETTNHRELIYACQYAPGRSIRVHRVTDLLSPDAVRVEATQRVETDGEVATTANILDYTFVSDSCGAIKPEKPRAVPQ